MSLEWTVGQEVIIRKTRGGIHDTEARVYKVGRKYGYAKPDDKAWPDVQFHLSSGREKSEFESYYRVVTPELLAEEDRRSVALDRVKGGGLETYGPKTRDIPTDVLEQIADLLDGAR